MASSPSEKIFLRSIATRWLSAADDTRDLDKAYDFFRTHSAATTIVSEHDLKRIRRKVDYRVITLLYLIFGIQYLDKVLLNYAINMGLPEDLGLHGQQLNNVASVLWIAYLIVSVPIGIWLNKFPIGRYLSINVILWSAAITCTAAVQGYVGLMAIRVLMGIFDAGMAPSIMWVSCQYYRKEEQAARFAIWFSSIGLAKIIGGLVSFGFLNLEHSSIENWRILYLVVGITSILIGLASWVWLPDTPMDAKFLSDTEKLALLRHISTNATGVQNSRFSKSQIVDCFTDFQVWILLAFSFATAITGGIVSTYSTTLIHGFGFNHKEAALLGMPSGGVAIIAGLSAACIMRYGWLPRWAVVSIYNVLGIMGIALLNYAPDSNRAAKMAGISCMSFGISCGAISHQWISANVAGHTKRAVALTAISASSALGNIVAPYAVQSNQAPKFELAKQTMLGAQLSVLGLGLILAVYYWLVNRRRDKMFGVVGTFQSSEDPEMWLNVTDRQRTTFRYVY